MFQTLVFWPSTLLLMTLLPKQYNKMIIVKSTIYEPRVAKTTFRKSVHSLFLFQVDRTPIHLAAQHGHFDIVDLLIAGGASVNHTDMVRTT